MMDLVLENEEDLGSRTQTVRGGESDCRSTSCTSSGSQTPDLLSGNWAAEAPDWTLHGPSCGWWADLTTRCSPGSRDGAPVRL